MQRTLSAFWSLKHTYFFEESNESKLLTVLRNSIFVVFSQESLLSSWPYELLWSILAQLAVLTYLYWHIMHLRACLFVLLAKQI